MTTVAEPSAALTLPQRAAVALASTETEKQLAALVSQAKEFKAITNAAGRDDCHSRYMALKNARVAVTKTGKAAREDAQAFATAVIAEEKRLVDIVADEEKRLLGLRDKWDAEREAEKEAERQAEAARIAAIQTKIDAIRDTPLGFVWSPSEEIEAGLAELDARIISLDEFGALTGHAQQAKGAAQVKLAELLIAARQAEAEARRLEEERIERARQEAEAKRIAEEQAAAERKRLADERAELERLRKEQEEAEAQARAEREEADRIAREEREAALAAINAERERAEAEAAERQAEQDRLDAEAQRRREAEQAEWQRLQDEQAARLKAELDELARQRAELEAAAKPVEPETTAVEPAPTSEPAYMRSVPAGVIVHPAVAYPSRPSDDELMPFVNPAINAIQESYDVNRSTALEWLRDAFAAELSAKLVGEAVPV